MNYQASMDEANNIGREAVRSAVILAKLRYDEQLAPFVRTSKERLQSDLVNSEIIRIAAECAVETGADAEKVYETLKKVLAEVVLPVTEPEKQKVDQGPESLPPAKNQKDKPEPQATTDVLDHGAVLEDEIREPDKKVDIESLACARCNSANVREGSVVCESCEHAIVAKAKKKEGAAWDKPRPELAQYPQMGGGAAQPAPGQSPQQMVPLNPNAPYQCVVCGRTGTFDDIKNHLDTATDVDHMRAKQAQGYGQQQLPGNYPPSQPQQPQASRTAGEYEEKQDNPNQTAVDEDPSTSPSGHFDDVVQEMANRAAARHFSTPKDEDINQIANTYGLDPNEVRQSIQITADFGNYHAANGSIGQYQVPEDYTEVNLQDVGTTNDSNETGQRTVEAVVPVNTAVKKAADDLGMDAGQVYAAVRDAYGGDLSDEYHISVQGEYHYYLPRTLMEKATNHPQPNAPQQQAQQPQQQQQPGIAVPQPDTGMQMASHFKLNESQLEVLLTRDGKLDDQRLARLLSRK